MTILPSKFRLPDIPLELGPRVKPLEEELGHDLKAIVEGLPREVAPGIWSVNGKWETRLPEPPAKFSERNEVRVHTSIKAAAQDQLRAPISPSAETVPVAAAPKFKVGDRVRLVGYEVNCPYISNPPYKDGTRGTVTGYTHEGELLVVMEGCSFSANWGGDGDSGDEMFELVTPVWRKGPPPKPSVYQVQIDAEWTQPRKWNGSFWEWIAGCHIGRRDCHQDWEWLDEDN